MQTLNKASNAAGHAVFIADPPSTDALAQGVPAGCNGPWHGVEARVKATVHRHDGYENALLADFNFLKGVEAKVTSAKLQDVRNVEATITQFRLDNVRESARQMKKLLYCC